MNLAFNPASAYKIMRVAVLLEAIKEDGVTMTIWLLLGVMHWQRKSGIEGTHH